MFFEWWMILDTQESLKLLSVKNLLCCSFWHTHITGASITYYRTLFTVQHQPIYVWMSPHWWMYGKPFFVFLWVLFHGNVKWAICCSLLICGNDILIEFEVNMVYFPLCPLKKWLSLKLKNWRDTVTVCPFGIHSAVTVVLVTTILQRNNCKSEKLSQIIYHVIVDPAGIWFLSDTSKAEVSAASKENA